MACKPIFLLAASITLLILLSSQHQIEAKYVPECKDDTMFCLLPEYTKAKRYYLCPAPGYTPYKLNCPSKYLFSFTNQTCVPENDWIPPPAVLPEELTCRNLPYEPPLIKCTDDTMLCLLPEVGNPKIYNLCPAVGYDPYRLKCPFILRFSFEKQTCVWPWQWTQSPVKQEGVTCKDLGAKALKGVEVEEDMDIGELLKYFREEEEDF